MASRPHRPRDRGSEQTVGLWAHRLSDLDGRTGVGRYAIELSRALSHLPVGDGDEPAIRYEVAGGREAAPPSAALADLPAQRSWPPRRALHLAWMAAGWPPIERVGVRVDLLHTLFPSFPVATTRPLVGTVHDLFTIDHPDWYGEAEHRSVSAALRRLADRAEAVVCVSRWVADQVTQRLGVDEARVRVVHSGIGDGWRRPPLDEAARRATSRPGRPYVVAVGALTPRKNIELVLRAVAQVEAAHLVLVGPSGPAARPVLDAVERLGVADRVTITGRVPDDELLALVQGAEALVHPSLDEGFGFPPLEAMAAGTPALVAAAGSLPEVVGPAAVVLPVGDSDRWAAAIEAVLTDPDHRAERSSAGRAWSSSFTWERAARQTAAVHREVLRGAARPT